jgi:hypothetical protein
MNKIRISRCAANKSVARALSHSRKSKRKTSPQQRQAENDERAVNCEICGVIQKLGLGKSAHELWLCTDKQVSGRGRRVAIVGRMNCRASNHLYETESGCGFRGRMHIQNLDRLDRKSLIPMPFLNQ